MTPAARKAAFKARQERIIATQSRPGLTACERLVIAIIGQHENLETGQCDPGIETIAKEGGLYERAVYRAIAGAERNGALAITRTGSGGRNGRNSYRLCGGNPDKSAGLNPDKRTLTKRSKNPDKCAPELTELPPPEEPLGSSSGGRGESEQPSAAFPPPPGAGGLVGPAPEEDQQEGAPSPSVEIQPQSKPDSRKESFAALRRVYARPWMDDDDEEAFPLYCGACGEVGHEAILDAAEAWVAAADAPRFLPSLTKWLRARGWEKPPPQKARAKTPSRTYAPSPQRKPSAAIAMLMAGQED